jgi:hypothetical protein
MTTVRWFTISIIITLAARGIITFAIKIATKMSPWMTGEAIIGTSTTAGEAVLMAW